MPCSLHSDAHGYVLVRPAACRRVPREVRSTGAVPVCKAALLGEARSLSPSLSPIVTHRSQPVRARVPSLRELRDTGTVCITIINYL